MRLLRARLALVLIAVTFLATGCGFTGLYGATLPGGADVGDHPYTVTMCFDNVLDLVPQSTVKVNDVEVGRVEKVELSGSGDSKCDGGDHGWTAKVEAEVNDDVQLPSNARATVRITSLLGEKYIDLEQPTDNPSSTDLANGSIIPISHTSSAPEIEQVLGALSLLLNGGGLPQIKTIVSELDKALKGNSGAIRSLLGQLNLFVDSLDKQKQQIYDSLTAVDTLTKTLNANKKIIEETLDTMPQALEILKDERSKFTTLLTSLSNLGSVATDVIDKTQSNLVSALKSLSPAVQQLAASGSDLTESLKIAGTFPFPLGTTLNAVKGDYANLHAFVDLNLTNELCALNENLCNIKLPLSDSGSGSTAVTSPTLITGG